MMMNDRKQLSTEIDRILDDFLAGNLPEEPIDTSSFSTAHKVTARKFNSFLEYIKEFYNFALNLAKGNISQSAPSRRNYLAGPIKEIHAQQTGFAYAMQQLVVGKPVSELYYPGEVYQVFNQLIRKVTALNDAPLPVEPNRNQWGDSSTSWRYHQLLSAVNQLAIMVIETDKNGRVLFSNPPSAELLAGVASLAGGGADDKVPLLKYLCSFADNIEDLMTERRISFPVFNELFDPYSNTWYRITTDKIQLLDGSYGLLHVIDDISDSKVYENQTTIETDSMTGAYTRKAGLAKLTELFNRRTSANTCVAFIDIDELKVINDAFGHNEGDYAISKVAELVMSCCRDDDWVIRYGGDEFLVLFQNCKEDIAQASLNRIYYKLDYENEINEKPYKISFSAGLALIDPTMHNTDDLINVIDSRMYVNKLRKKSASYN